MGKKYEKINVIVAHMGGGVTVGAHRKGKVVDVNNGIHGEGPMSPERSGGLPVEDVVNMCFQASIQKAKWLIKYTEKVEFWHTLAQEI